jgi:glycosyltransferase involved in cell wall biosynthesis
MSPHRIAPRSADGRVALAHDFLNQHGGAERVVLAMSDIWPRAPIHTSLYRPDSTFPEFRGRDIRTSFLQHLPVDRRFRALLPLYPVAFESMRVDAPVVISSSSAFAHGIGRPTDSFHAVYCYTPARWLYRWDYLGARSRAELAAAPLRPALRRWDQRAARQADLYIAISRVVQQRIAQVYGRYAPIVHPPVDIDRFSPSERGARLLVVSRLLPYKRVDVVVRAATHAGVGLDVVGDGPDLDRLRSLAGPTVEFHGMLPDSAVTELMEHCSALCVPGSEDFGLTPVEAQAAGKPVIAFASGGALETVEDGVTGTLFAERSTDAFLRGLRRLERLDTSSQEIAAHAERFSPVAFADRLCDVLSAALLRAETEEPRSLDACVSAFAPIPG